eukprot:2827353-Amphidinium_carterae.1
MPTTVLSRPVGVVWVCIEDLTTSRARATQHGMAWAKELPPLQPSQRTVPKSQVPTGSRTQKAHRCT